MCVGKASWRCKSARSLAGGCIMRCPCGSLETYLQWSIREAYKTHAVPRVCTSTQTAPGRRARSQICQPTVCVLLVDRVPDLIFVDAHLFAALFTWTSERELHAESLWPWLVIFVNLYHIDNVDVSCALEASQQLGMLDLRHATSDSCLK
ncbi:hypothetical protein QAD02_017412 [Eretmocerus hayati]|uniref:Uncharacterized protein n=1 Tax=Eretmocerus hayati TaxID=131215 RepID=A0ACC2PDV4_9HYME|nr:hypothetical protein QAD02_017412 [Eretmocerus hayati]